MFDCVFCHHDCVEGSVIFVGAIHCNCKCGSVLHNGRFCLETLRGLEHWLVSCWCGCSHIRFCFRALIVHDVRVSAISRFFRNGMLGFYLSLRAF